MEIWQHIMRCTKTHRQTWQQTTIKAVTDKCQSLSTRPALQEVLIAGVNGWLNSNEEKIDLDPAPYHQDI
jgi:hypothetical protein